MNGIVDSTAHTVLAVESGSDNSVERLPDALEPKGDQQAEEVPVVLRRLVVEDPAEPLH